MRLPGGLDRLLADDRAIEGLPVRLVVAFVVGVASLSVMLNTLSGVGGLAVSELNVRPAPDVVSPAPQTVAVTAVDAEGHPVADALVVVRSGTATVDGVVTARTGPNGTARLHLDPDLAANQVEGTLEVDVKPPAGSQYVDERENTDLLVLRD
ncbi:MAG: carboxypeptidase regulatory-like domain-containing protein [Halobacteriaceae archaeon]